MAYPVNLDNPALTTDGVDDADETLFNDRIISPIRRTQGYVGTTGDTASSDPAATLTANLKFLLNAADDAYAAALWIGGD